VVITGAVELITCCRRILQYVLMMTGTFPLPNVITRRVFVADSGFVFEVLH
jgi:hypothetical protein